MINNLIVYSAEAYKKKSNAHPPDLWLSSLVALMDLLQLADRDFFYTISETSPCECDEEMPEIRRVWRERNYHRVHGVRNTESREGWGNFVGLTRVITGLGELWELLDRI